MKPVKNICRSILAVFLAFVLIVSPLPVTADGGPIVGPGLWASLKEGHQIAVITIKDTATAEVDLFISILDGTGESHEVVFFIPLGERATDFRVLETNSWVFDQRNTEDWDDILGREARTNSDVIVSLFGATLLTNGVWLMPLWLPLIFSGCGAPPPEAIFETDSSQVSIYGLDEDTDLEGLISTTGLDESVRETLSRLRGQKIAVVNLQTEPRGSDGGPGEYRQPGEPGIQLSWTTSLIEGENGGTYAYPLGTGTAWHHPVEMTRVYVIAPPGIDFSVEYPELGADSSGYTRVFGGLQQRIVDNYDTAAFAVDEAVGDFGHVWRAVYMQSNAGEDIIITAGPQSSFSRFYASLHKGKNSGLALLFGFIVALALWLLSWRYLAPRLLPANYRGDPEKAWKAALLFTGINFILMIPGIILYVLWSWTGSSFILAFLFILFGGASLIYFAVRQIKHLDMTIGQALKVYGLVTLASNGAYLVLALAYTKLTGVI